jgi:hypothetical protein
VIEDEPDDMTFAKGTEHEFTLKDVRPIRTDESCRKYKITFNGFFVYQVVEEGSIEWSDKEIFTGKYVRVFTESRFLEFIKDNLCVAWFAEDPSSAYKHFEFPRSNFIVDVAAATNPEIELVEDFLLK